LAAKNQYTEDIRLCQEPAGYLFILWGQTKKQLFWGNRSPETQELSTAGSNGSAPGPGGPALFLIGPQKQAGSMLSAYFAPGTPQTFPPDCSGLSTDF
jgi:hypothetical protein